MRHERRPSVGASYRCSLALPNEAFSQNTDLLPGLDERDDPLSYMPKEAEIRVEIVGERNMCTQVCLPGHWESSSLRRDRCACSQIPLPTKSTKIFAIVQMKALRGTCPVTRHL